MAVIVAPWLETKPTDFLNAAKSGAQAGTELRGQDLEHQARMAAIAQQGADAQMRAAEEHERNQIAGEVAKNRIALQTGNAANILQQQRQRQFAIDGGMDPIQAWLQYPGTTSGSPGAGAFQALNQQRRAALPLEQVPDPNNPGKIAGFHDGSRFYPLPQQKSESQAATKINPLDMVAIKHYQNMLKSAEDEMTKTAGFNSPNNAALQIQAANARRALRKFGVNFDGPAGAAGAQATAPGMPASAPAKPGLPTQGQVINGHRFVGGDPADKNSWQEVNPEGSSFIGTPGQPNEAELPGSMQSPQPVPDETEDQPAEDDEEQ